MKRFILDSFPLMALLQGDSSAAMVESVLNQAGAGEIEVWMNVINFGEVLYLIERRFGSHPARKMMAEVLALPVQWDEATFDRVRQAAHLKAHHSISYPDAFAAALAQSLDATLLTGDPEFRALEGMLDIEWLQTTE